MKYKSTLLLFLLVAITAGTAYFLSQRPTPQQLRETNRSLLPDFNRDAIRRLEILTPDSHIHCRKNEDGNWRIDEPISLRADSERIREIITALARAEKISTVRSEDGTAPVDSAYGLK